MERNPLTSERLLHLSSSIRLSFTKIEFDRILSQIQQHKVSREFTQDRIEELFTLVLRREQEEFYQKLVLDYESAKSAKKELKQRLVESERCGKEQLSTVRASNYPTQKRYIDAQTKYDSICLQLKGSKSSIHQRRRQIRGVYSSLIPHLQAAKEEACNIRQIIDEAKQNIENLMEDFHIYVQHLRSGSIQKAQKVVSDAYKSGESEELSSEIRSLRASSSALEVSIKEVLQSLIPTDGKRGSLQIEELKSGHIEQLLTKIGFGSEERTIKEYLPLFKGGKNGVKAALKESFKAEIDTVKEKYLPQIEKQNKKMNELQKELKEAEDTLRIGEISNSSIDQSLFKQLEESQENLLGTQKKTDQLMSLLGRRSSSSSIASMKDANT